MIKLSFDKKLTGDPIKTQVLNNTVTKVTITGVIIENLGIYTPMMVENFIEKYPGVKAYYSGGAYVITATGVSKKILGDAYNKVLGYRIAESRAKIKLYRFMLNLCKKYMKVVSPILFGTFDISFDYEYKVDSVPRDITKYQKLLDTEMKHLNNLIHGANTKSSE
nr:MAG TPA: hypothetical protein [Caudoviricetes sp.]